MSLSSWKQFSFLHYSPIRDPNFNTETPLFSDPSISAICSSDKYIMFAIASSIIKIVDLEFNLVYQFVGFEPNFTISYLKHSQVNNMNVICAVGESLGFLRYWNFGTWISWWSLIIPRPTIILIIIWHRLMFKTAPINSHYRPSQYPMIFQYLRSDSPMDLRFW